MPLTQEDRDMIYYYFEEGDITYWSDWEDKKQMIMEEAPALIAALNSLKIAEQTLEAVVNAVLMGDL